ncbi:hypothetical protein MPSEU_000038000 [Mayamaea pseudoterrestris]|nr:hypothetical protein MPSEU_000038000 [Mayamaea pseudoterrestris]
MMERRFNMPRRIIEQKLFLALLIIGTLLVPEANAEPELCPGSTTEFGYTSINSINTDITNELMRIQSGATPNGIYTYSLCRNTVFDANAGPLRPGLSNSFFICGPDGNPNNKCTIQGGNIQVEIVNSMLPNYELAEITFLGIQFSGFTTQAVSAYASFPTQANFRNVLWTDFTSEFVVRQQPGNGTSTDIAPPMTIDISNSTVSDGTTSAVFDNDGGSLRVQQLQATGVTAPALMATSNGGNSFFQDSVVSASRLDYVTETSGSGAQSVINVQVRDMLSMVNTFRVQDVGSQLTINSGATITNNKLSGSRFSGVYAETGATAKVNDFTMSGNEGVAFAFYSVGVNTNVQVADSIVDDNVGTANPRFISAPGIALSNGILSVDSTLFNQNNQFAGALLALVGSQLNIVRSCFTNSQSEYVVFVDAKSNYTQSDNFVSGYSSSRCATESGRLFQENSEAGCFTGSNICTGECRILANATVCMASTMPTAAPGFPTAIPTTMPTSIAVGPSAMPTVELTTEPVPTQRPSTSRVPVPTAVPTTLNTVQPPTIDTFIPTTLTNNTSQPTTLTNNTIQPTSLTNVTFQPTVAALTGPPSNAPSPVPITPAQSSQPGAPTYAPLQTPTTRQTPRPATPSPTACLTSKGIKGSKLPKAPKGSKGWYSKGAAHGSNVHELCSSSKKEDKKEAKASKGSVSGALPAAKAKYRNGSWSGSDGNGIMSMIYVSDSGSTAVSGKERAKYGRDLRDVSPPRQKRRIRHHHSRR